MTFYSQELRNIGKLITFGSLNLSLTLKLEKVELQSLNLNFRKIKTINDLSFIVDNEKLWEKIELSSKNELLNTLFHMNRIKKIKNIVAYLVYDKMEFSEEQKKFQRLLDCILLSNGVVIYSYEICKCNNNISFNLIYKNFRKKIMLYGEDDYEEYINPENQTELDDINDSIMNNSKSKLEDSNHNINNSVEHKIINNNEKENKKEENVPEDEEESKDNDNNDIGLFDKIPENEVNFEDFRYIYFYLKDYVYGGEFYNVFRLREIYNFLKKIKIQSKIKIILNFTENLKSIEKYLIKFLKISDIHIIRNKVELLDILIKRKEIEDKNREKNNKKLIELLKVQKTKLIKKIKTVNNRNDNKSASREAIRSNKLYKSSGITASNSSFSRKFYHKSESLKNILIAKSLNLTFDKKNKNFLDKNNMFNYIHSLIYCPFTEEMNMNNNDKLGIYLDDFKKIYIKHYKKVKLKEDTKEYDLNIYPKSNIHNLKEIESIRDILYANYMMFSYIIYGCILSTILDDLSKGFENYYLFYFYIRISVLKILSLIKKGMPIPTSKSFFIIEIKKSELNKIISEENTKRKENGFNMDYFHKDYKEKEDNISISAIDKYRTICMQNFSSLDPKKFQNLLNENNKIFSDFKLRSNNCGHMTNQKFANFFLQKNIKIREKNFRKQYLSKRNDMKYTMIGTQRIPEYAVYLSKDDRKKIMKGKLPPVRLLKSSTNTTSLMNTNISKFMEKEKDNENEEIEKIDTAKYKEIIFQPTQKET